MSFDKARFGDLFAEPQKNGLTKPKKVRGAGLPMVNMGELFAHSRIKNLSMDLVPVDGKEMQYCLRPGDLLFARQSLVLEGAGQCSIFLGNDSPTVFESHLIRCRLDQLRFNAHFYFYFFRSPEGRRAIETIVEQGAGAAGIRGSDLVKLQVPAPEKGVQDEIASVLATLDDRITLLRETNATLEAIAQALFKSWFVDFDPVRAKMEGRPPEGMDEATAALFPAEFEETTLGSMPRGWRVGDVYDVANVRYGAPFASRLFNADRSGLPLVRIRDLKDEAPGVWTPELHPKGCKVFPGDIVVGMDGEFRAYLWGGEPAWMNQRICKFEPCNGHSAAYVKMVIRAPLAHIEATETATTVIHLGKSDIDRFRVNVPPPQVATAFGAACQPLYDRIVANKQAMRTLALVRDTLLPRLISGQLRLPDAPDASGSARATAAGMPTVTSTVHPSPTRSLRMNSRPASDLHFVSKREPLPTVEVSVDSLQENQLSLDAILAPALRRFAAAHPELRATINIHSSPSVNFNNTPGYSEFLIVAGPDKLLQRVHAALERAPDVRCRYSEYIRLDQGAPAYHLEDGQLWEPEDSLTWFTQGPAAPAASAPEGSDAAPVEVSPNDWPIDEAVATPSDPASTATNQAASRGTEPAARYRAARSDATVARIRQTIEEVFGLPTGSVALCGPDGRALRGDALIKTLRRRWEDN